MNKDEQKKNYTYTIKRLESIKESNPSIHDFLLTDILGKVVAATDKRDIGLDKSMDDFFINGQKNTHIKDAYYFKNDNEQLIDVSTPVIDADNNDVLGVLAARIELKTLDKIVTDGTGLKNTGEIYIVNKHGYMITPSRFIPDVFLKQKSDTANYKNCLINKNKKMHEKIDIFINYRGKMVLGSCEYIPEMDWVLLGEIEANEAFASLKKVQFVFLMLLIIVPLIAFILGKIISEIISKPILELQNGIEIIGEGNLKHRVGTDAQDEIGRLSRAFDEMTRKLGDAREKLILSEKLAVAGKLSSSIAHDVRGPLSVIKSIVYNLKMFPVCADNLEIMKKLGKIGNEIDVSDKVINNFLELTRIKEPVLHPENINLIITEVLSGFQINPDIKPVIDFQDNLPETLLDKVQIWEVFYNLIKNALEAISKGGILKIKTVLKGDFIEIVIEDTGCGIPVEDIGKIYEPLFTTKAKGTGLGLYISASLVEKHHGKIEVESKAGKGTIFTVKLPFST